MATCEWNETIGGAVFADDEGRIQLVVLARPDDAIIAEYEAMYPGLPIRVGIEHCFPEDDNG